MADVARQAGVSLMTVSRVVNNKDDVSAETRQHVQTTIKQLGYRPSDIARGLVTRRTGAIGLVVPDVSNPYFSEVVRGAEHVAYAKNYSVLLCNTEEDTERELAVLQSLEEKRVDGVVLCSSRLAEDELQEAISRHPAAVLVNRRLEFSDARAGVGVVTLNDVADPTSAQWRTSGDRISRRTADFVQRPGTYGGLSYGDDGSRSSAAFPVDQTLRSHCRGRAGEHA